MKAIRLQIYLEEPLLMTGVANGEENSSTSLSYIPGSALRGACIGHYRQQHPDIDLDIDPNSRSLFFDNKLFFLNGYPASPFDKTHRAIPRPYAWHMDKAAGNNDNREVRDYIWDVEPFERSKREGRSFYWQSPDDVYALTTPARWSNVHNASLEPMLKKEGTSNVFRYDALARGQTFVAYVAGPEDEWVNAIEDYLPSGRWYLGGSQTAGYGSVTVQAASAADWPGESEPDYDIEEYTIITLLSDALLSAADGRPTTDFHMALELALGRELAQPQQSYVGINLVGGFNRKWGLPLPQRWAVAMGSTFVYDMDDLDSDDLDELIERGIGWRRGEGFGRIGVNLNAKSSFPTTTPTQSTSAPQTLSADSRKLAQEMAKRRLLQTVHTEILRHVDEISIHRPQPQNTQLSQLRLVLRQAQRENDLSYITTHLDDLKDTASNQFSDSRLDVTGGKVSWERWLRRHARQNDGLATIGIDIENVHYQIAGEQPVEDVALKTEVTCQLIEALIRKAMREAEDE